MGVTGDPDDGRASHGLCPACHAHLEASIDGIPLHRFLDSIDIPVALVDGNVRVVYANPSAHQLLDKPLDAIEHHLGGEVFECEYSYLPGGCGRTTKCSACTFRNAVTRCYETGEAEHDIVVTLKQRTDHGPAALSLRISTRKANNRVLLSIVGMERP
jgi:PAS domain-containing protein